MKSLALCLALFSLPVFADPIPLGPDGCGVIKQCIAIPNDAGASVDLYGAPTYPYFYIVLDGVQYKSGVASGYGFDSVSLQADDGSTILASGSFTTYRTCVTTGRGRTCYTHWQFVGGSIVR